MRSERRAGEERRGHPHNGEYQAGASAGIVEFCLLLVKGAAGLDEHDVCCGLAHTADARMTAVALPPSRTYVRPMGWHQQPGTVDRWIATDDEGRQVGWVALTVGPGAAYRYWVRVEAGRVTRRGDGREFPNAEEAMRAIERGH